MTTKRLGLIMNGVTGRMGLNQHLIRSIVAIRTQVSMVFQRFNLFPHRTALENVIEGPLYVKKEPREQAIARGRALLAQVGLADKAEALVRGAGIWTDQKWPWISILSLASLADLEARTGQTLGIHRWRGNLWIDGWQPWAERALIGQVISIGSVELRVTQHVGRCAATSANTDTGENDIDMLDSLERLYGHTDFGIFAEVVTGGAIALGDEVAA